jgi:putrescine importer
MSATKLERKLGLVGLVVIGLAYMTPMAVFDTFGIITDLTQGHVAGAYVVTTLAVLLTAWSYIQMVKVYPNAGSAYTFAQKTVGPKLGFLVGWAALADYLLLPLINVLLPRIYLAPVFPWVPDWVWVVSFTAAITMLNIFGLKMSIRVTALLLATQFAICAAIVGFAFWATPAESYNLRPLVPLDIPTALAGAAILVYSFLGFDAITTLSEDAHDPTRNIPKAVLYTALVGGGLFVMVTYFVQLQYPDASGFIEIDAASQQIALELGGPGFQIAFALTAGFASLASGMAAQVSASRLLYVMGRDELLPKRYFGYLSEHSKNPTFNILLIGTISLGAVFIPLSVAVSLISFGALIAFSFVNLAVIIHYLILKKERGFWPFIRYGLLPSLGLAYVALLWTHLQQLSLIGGLSWAAIGIIYAFILWRMRGIDPFAALATAAEAEDTKDAKQQA